MGSRIKMFNGTPFLFDLIGFFPQKKIEKAGIHYCTL